MMFGGSFPNGLYRNPQVLFEVALACYPTATGRHETLKPRLFNC